MTSSGDTSAARLGQDAQLAELALVIGQDLLGLEAGIERALVPIYVYDPDRLGFVAANAAALRLYGFSESEMMHLSILDIRPAEEIPRLKAFLAEGWPPGVRHAGVWRHRTMSGRVFNARTIGMNTVFNGRPARVPLVEEMTPTAYAADSVTQLLFPFAEQMEDVAWIRALRSGCFVYLNPAFEKVIGLPREAAFADPETPGRLVHADDLAAYRRFRREQAAGPAELEFRIRRSDGTERWLLVRSFLLRDAAGEMMCAGISKDVTARKQDEQRRHAEAAAQCEVLMREVHHRIKNSLQGVSGLLRQFATAHPDVEPVLAQAAALLRGVALTHGLQGGGPDGQVDLPDLASGIVANIEALTREGIALRIVVPKTIRATLDHSQAVPVALALNELAFNAVKHKDGKGSVRLALKVDAKAGCAELHLSNPGRLPSGFATGTFGSGLKLVADLLRGPGATLGWHEQDGRVEARLALMAPLLNCVAGPVER